MENKEDKDWIDALAGKTSPNADPKVVQRATLLRQAIQKQNAALGLSDVEVEAGIQKMMFRLRRDEIGRVEPRKFINDRYAQFAIAASIILTVGLTMRVYLHDQPIQNEAEIMRGGSDRQLVLTPDPETRLNQITTELDRLGIKYQIERKEGKILLLAHGVDPTKDDVAGFLQRNHITPPVQDSLELDIRQLSKQ
jgi:hypothetical protein